MDAKTPSVQEIIGLWASIDEFSSDAGVEPNTGKQMRTRGRISPRYWHALVEGAERRGFSGVTYEILARAHAVKPATSEVAA